LFFEILPKFPFVVLFVTGPSPLMIGRENFFLGKVVSYNLDFFYTFFKHFLIHHYDASSKMLRFKNKNEVVKTTEYKKSHK